MSNEDKPKVVQKASPSPWLKDLKNQHKVFKFSNSVPASTKKPESKVEPLY